VVEYQLSSRSLPSHLHHSLSLFTRPRVLLAAWQDGQGEAPAQGEAPGRVRLRPNRGFPRRLSCDVTSQNQSTSRSRPARPLSDRKTGHCHPRFWQANSRRPLRKRRGKPRFGRSLTLPGASPCLRRGLATRKVGFKAISIRVHSCSFAVKNCSCSTCACAPRPLFRVENIPNHR
jgi:hypothetical protein